MLTVIILFVLGLAGGSFVNAAVWRIRQQSLVTSRQLPAKKGKIKTLATSNKQLATKKTQLSILSGRSQCVHCGHKLAVRDLVPILSWVFLRGRCRYCGKPISTQYPIAELTAGLVFAGSYSFWPGGVYGIGDWLELSTWLAASIGLLALAVYDLRWMILPNKIIYPTLFVAAAGRLAYITVFETQPARAVELWLLSVAVASGVFYVIFMVSSGKWIGYGDVRLGLITGTLLAHPAKSLAMIFAASLLGTLVAAPDLARGRKSMASRLPYGPFLIIGTAIVVLFGDSLLEWYQRLLT